MLYSNFFDNILPELSCHSPPGGARRLGDMYRSLPDMHFMSFSSKCNKRKLVCCWNFAGPCDVWSQGVMTPFGYVLVDGEVLATNI